METKLAAALTEFREKYPDVTSADLQTFILGWKAAKKVLSNPELLEALKSVFDLIDRNILVRDISKDNDYNYFLKQGIEINNAIILGNKAIKKATGKELKKI